MKRYYYKKDGIPAYNLKEPLENVLSDTTGYVEITEQEWNALQPAPYVPTQEENAARERENEIAFLKSELARTDYCIIKIAEGVATAEEYADVISQRATWRARINELESQL